MRERRLFIGFMLCLLVMVFPSMLCAAQMAEPQEYRMGTFNLKKVAPFTYEDEDISLTWRIGLNRINFELKNRTSGIIEVEWDKFSFTNADGRVDRMIHGGVLYVDRKEPQSPTILPPRGRMVDSLIPVNNLYWDDSIVEYDEIIVKEKKNSKGEKEKTTIKIPRERDKGDNDNWNLCELAPWPRGGRIFNSVGKYKSLYAGRQLSVLMTLTFNARDTRYYVFNFDFPEYAETPARSVKIPSRAKMLVLGERTENGFIRIAGVAKGGLAEKKGIAAGDTLVEIDGKSVSNMEIRAVKKYILDKLNGHKSIIIVYDHEDSRNMVMLK